MALAMKNFVLALLMLAFGAFLVKVVLDNQNQLPAQQGPSLSAQPGKFGN